MSSYPPNRPLKLQLRALLATLAMTASTLLLTLPSLVWAHPSGLPALRRRADYFVATSDDWLFWDFHPSIVIGILAMTALYTLGITRWRKRYGWADEIDKGRAALFYSSMVLLWFTLDGPLHHLSDELLFSAHMIQHLVLQLVWAGMFVLSMPGWLLRPLVKNPRVRRLAVWLTRPTQAFILYNAVTWVWHFPAMYNLALEAHEFHIMEHLLFMSTAVIFYWPLLSPLEEVPRPTHGPLLLYVFANMAAMKSLGVFISMQNEVIYTYYLKAPRVWGLTAISDQQIGGMLMWLPGGLILWGGLGYVFFQWAMKGTPARGTTDIAHIDAARAARAQELS